MEFGNPNENLTEENEKNLGLKQQLIDNPLKEENVQNLQKSGEEEKQQEQNKTGKQIQQQQKEELNEDVLNSQLESFIFKEDIDKNIQIENSKKDTIFQETFQFFKQQSQQRVSINLSINIFTNEQTRSALKKIRSEQSKDSNLDQIARKIIRQSELIIKEEGRGLNLRIAWSDFIGARVKQKESPKKFEGPVQLSIYEFPKRQKKFFQRSEKRELKQWQFSIYDEKLGHKIDNILKYFLKASPLILKYSNLNELPLYKPLKLLVFMNQQSEKQWKKVDFLLQAAGYSFNQVETLYNNHCKDYVRDLSSQNILQYSAIVYVSGSGSPHEIINGLLTRPDRKQVIHIPIGTIPLEDGNSLASTLCTQSNETISKEGMVYLICQGFIRKIDIIQFQRQSQNPVYSIESLSWGTSSEADVETQKLKFIGDSRQNLFGMWRSLKSNPFKAQVSFSEISDELGPLVKPLVGAEWQTIEEEFNYFLTANTPWISETVEASPFSKIDDGYMDLQYLLSKQGKWQMLKTTFSFGKGEHINKESGDVQDGYQIIGQKIQSLRIQPLGDEKGIYLIDGHKYPAVDIQGTVLNQIATIFSR